MSRASSSEIKVMLDAETLSNIAVTAPMISLGAVKFLADGTIVDKFKENNKLDGILFFSLFVNHC